MRRGNNIDFNPPAESLYIPPAIQEEADNHGTTYPEPQPQPMAPHPELEEQKQRIGMLEKLTKWQNKTIKALKNTVNEMKGQIKELQGIVSCSSKRYEAQGPVMMERSRSSSAAHKHQPHMEPPRASATIFYQRKRRAARSPVGSTSFRDQDFAQNQDDETHATSFRDHHVAPNPDYKYATFFRDQDTAQNQGDEMYATSFRDHHVAPSSEHQYATTPLDHDLAWEVPACPEPITTIPPSEGSASETNEAMDEDTSSLFSKP